MYTYNACTSQTSFISLSLSNLFCLFPNTCLLFTLVPSKHLSTCLYFSLIYLNICFLTVPIIWPCAADALDMFYFCPGVVVILSNLQKWSEQAHAEVDKDGSMCDLTDLHPEVWNFLFLLSIFRKDAKYLQIFLLFLSFACSLSLFRGEGEGVTSCSSGNSAHPCKSGNSTNTTGRWMSSIYWTICLPQIEWCLCLCREALNTELTGHYSLDLNLFNLLLTRPFKFIFVINFPGSDIWYVPHFQVRLQKARDQLGSCKDILVLPSRYLKPRIHSQSLSLLLGSWHFVEVLRDLISVTVDGGLIKVM